jgi:hypothetical protein
MIPSAIVSIICVLATVYWRKLKYLVTGIVSTPVHGTTSTPTRIPWDLDDDLSVHILGEGLTSVSENVRYRQICFLVNKRQN